MNLFYDQLENCYVDIRDFKLALAAWFLNEDSEWSGDGDAWDDEDLRRLMEKYNLSKEDVLKAAPKEWTI